MRLGFRASTPRRRFGRGRLRFQTILTQRLQHHRLQRHQLLHQLLERLGKKRLTVKSASTAGRHAFQLKQEVAADFGLLMTQRSRIAIPKSRWHPVTLVCNIHSHHFHNLQPFETRTDFAQLILGSAQEFNGNKFRTKLFFFFVYAGSMHALFEKKEALKPLCLYSWNARDVQHTHTHWESK